MASERAKKARLALAGGAALCVVGGVAVYMLSGSPGPTNATYTPPPPQASAPATAAQQAQAGSSQQAAPAPAPQQQATAAPVGERLFVLGSSWQTLPVLGAAPPASQGTGYRLSFGYTAQPVVVPPLPAPQPPTMAEVNSLAQMIAGTPSHQGAICVTEDQAVCLISVISRAVQLQGQQGRPFYIVAARMGGGLVPLATTDGMKQVPLIVDTATWSALFPDTQKTNNALIGREAVSEYLLTMAANTAMREVLLGMNQYDRQASITGGWIDGMGYQESKITFRIGGGSLGGSMRLVAEVLPQRGFYRLSAYDLAFDGLARGPGGTIRPGAKRTGTVMGQRPNE